MTGSSTYDERYLLSCTAAGDEVAFAALFEQNRHRVYNIAWKALKSTTAAEDALQEIFMTVWTQRHKLTDISSFKAWLYTITRNHLINRLRRQSNEIAYIREALYRGKDNYTDIFDTVVWNDLHNVLLQAVTMLSPQQRKVFELDRFEGLKHAEIAEKLGISKSTVKKHIMEAMKNIKAHFIASGRDIELLAILLLTLH